MCGCEKNIKTFENGGNIINENVVLYDIVDLDGSIIEKDLTEEGLIEWANTYDWYELMDISDDFPVGEIDNIEDAIKAIQGVDDEGDYTVVRKEPQKLENGGVIESFRRFTEGDFNRLTYDDFEGRWSGYVWEIKHNDSPKVLGKFNPKKNTLFILGKKDLTNPLVKWLQQNSFVSSDEYRKLEKGGKINKNWIADALSGGKNKGALRRTALRKGLLRNEDEKLSMTDLHKLEKVGGKTAKRAYLAETLRKFNNGGGINSFNDSTEKAKKEINFLIEKGYSIDSYSTNNQDSAFGEGNNVIFATQGSKRPNKNTLEFAIAYFYENDESGVMQIDESLLDSIADGFSNFKVTLYTNAGVDLHSKYKGNYKNIEVIKVPFDTFNNTEIISELDSTINKINPTYDGVRVSKVENDNRIQVISPYFNTLSAIKRNEFNGSGLIQKLSNTSSLYVLYSNKAYFENGGLINENWGNNGSTPSNNEDYNNLYALFPDNHAEAKAIWNQLSDKQKSDFIYDLEVTDAASEHIAESWLEFINSSSQDDYWENATNWDEMRNGGEVGGRGWGKFKKGEKISSLEDVKVGEIYLEHSNQFNSNNIILINSGDTTGLNRDIVYASFVRPNDLKGREETFAIWGHDLESKIDLYKIKGRKYEFGGNVNLDVYPYEDKTENKSKETLVRENIYNGEIQEYILKNIIGKNPEYPYEIVGSLKLTKCFLRPYYKI